MPEKGTEYPGGWPGPRHADGPLTLRTNPLSPGTSEALTRCVEVGNGRASWRCPGAASQRRIQRMQGQEVRWAQRMGRRGCEGPLPPACWGRGDAVQSFIHSQLFSHPCTREHPCLEAAGCTGEGWGVGPLVPRPPPSRAPHPPAQVLLSLPITQDPGTIPTGTLRGGRGWKGILQALPDGPLWCGDTDPRGSRGFPWQPLLPRCVDGPGMPTPEREAAAWSWGSRQCGHHPGNCTPLASL